MLRIVLALCLGLTGLAPILADEAQNAQSAEPSNKEKLQADPNDATALNAYVIENLRELLTLAGQDPDKAEQRLKEVNEFLDSLEPEDDLAKSALLRGRSALRTITQRIELARVSLDDLKKQIEESPDDQAAITRYVTKVTQELSPLVRSQPEQADEKLTAAKTFLENVKSKAEEDATKQAVDRHLRSLARYEAAIESGKKLAALVGKEAAPLDVAAWVNGSPLTDEDLKGKVVLLDFWAIWCGPCIATFPHLREWQEKYADKGLVIIGLTRYYNYEWDEEDERAKRSQTPVSPEDEHKMLERFAEHHNLEHRFALQTERSLSDYYAVTGIPHVVLIDQDGIVRLVRVGSGAPNARDISEMLAKLLEQ